MSAPPAPPPNPPPVARTIETFEQDDEGAWVAWLACGHRRHIRHRPPMDNYPWVMSAEGRAGRIGQSIECGRCSMRVWPEGLEHRGSSREFTHENVPASLLAAHTTRAGVWGKLRVLEGELFLDFRDALGTSDELAPGTDGVIPPEIPHRVQLRGPVRFVVEFHHHRPKTAVPA